MSYVVSHAKHTFLAIEHSFLEPRRRSWALAGNKRNLSIGLRSLEDQLLERTSKLYETWDFCVFHSGLSFASRTWIDDNRHRLDQNMVFGHRSL